MDNQDTNIQKIYLIVNTITQQKNIFLHSYPQVALKYFQKFSNSQSIQKAEDYKLILIGEWDSHTGKITAYEEEELIEMGKFEKAIDKELGGLIEELVLNVVSKKNLSPLIKQTIKKEFFDLHQKIAQAEKKAEAEKAQEDKK